MHVDSQPSSGQVLRGESRLARPHPVVWMIAGALGVLAYQSVVSGPREVLRLDNAAFAQTVSSGGARGLFAFSGQLSKNSYGIFMVDVDAMTLWAYEYQPQKECLRLAAARTWRYDRYLENHNGCDLPPEAVEKMIEDQRQFRLDESEKKMP